MFPTSFYPCSVACVCDVRTKLYTHAVLHVYVMLELNETNGGLNAILTGLVGVGHGRGGLERRQIKRTIFNMAQRTSIMRNTLEAHSRSYYQLPSSYRRLRHLQMQTWMSVGKFQV